MQKKEYKISEGLLPYPFKMPTAGPDPRPFAPGPRPYYNADRRSRNSVFCTRHSAFTGRMPAGRRPDYRMLPTVLG